MPPHKTPFGMCQSMSYTKLQIYMFFSVPACLVFMCKLIFEEDRHRIAFAHPSLCGCISTSWQLPEHECKQVTELHFFALTVRARYSSAARNKSRSVCWIVFIYITMFEDMFMQIESGLGRYTCDVATSTLFESFDRAVLRRTKNVVLPLQDGAAEYGQGRVFILL